jgi:hypothetical protein
MACPGAEGIAQRRGPEKKQSRKLRLGWWFQVQNHDRDNHRKDPSENAASRSVEVVPSVITAPCWLSIQCAFRTCFLLKRTQTALPPG